MSHKRYWTTLEELQHDPRVEKLRHEEFASKPQEYFDALPKGGLKVGRRDFMKWSAGALALVATACERKPTETLTPYAQNPEGMLPGVAQYYATTCQECSAGCGVVAKTREGRPIKLEGNPLHPLNRGTLCARGQASLFNLYDPDRLRTPVALNRVHSLNRLVGNAAQPDYNIYVPTNVWETGEYIRNHPHPIDRVLRPVGWADADKQLASWLDAAGGRGVLLTGTIHGPARRQLLEDFLAVYPLRHVMYDARNPDALLAARAAAFGAPAVAGALPRYDFERAEIVVTLGGDLLAESYSPQEWAVGFGRQRKLRNQTMSRVVAFEPRMSLTGMAADSRFLVPPSQLGPVAMALAHAVAQRGGVPAEAQRVLAAYEPAAIESRAGLPAGTIDAVAADLWANRGQGIVYGGGLAAPDAAALEAVAAFLNSALGNEGSTILATSPSQQAQGSDAAMLELCAAMRAGQVETLLVYGTNPVYTLPAAAGFEDALAHVPNVVVIADRLNETAQLGNLVLPSLHAAESWGDAEPQAGLYSLVQPTIEPLFNGRGFEDTLIQVGFLHPAGAARFKAPPPPPAPVPPAAPTGVPAAAPAAPAAPKAAPPAKSAAPAGTAATAAAATAAAPAAAAAAPAPAAAAAITFHDYLKQHWQTELYARNNPAGSFDDFWMGVLRAGVFDPNPTRTAAGPAAAWKGALPAFNPAPAAAGEFELALYVNPIVGDGAVNNNALLLEIPDPVTRICWDNFAMIAQPVAQKLGWQEGDLVTLALGDRKLELPLHVQVGVHPAVVAVAIGYGRASVGNVGSDVGANAYALAAPTPRGVVYSGARVRLARTGGGYLLASPQGNNYLDFDDPIVPELDRKSSVIHDTTLVQIQANPRAGNAEQEPPANLWNNSGPSDHPYPGRRWGMTVDLNACIGCNACVAACYAENNVPVVGKDQVWRGREMAWIRIDRYFTGPLENPEVVTQPMMCQQCGNAGCESVCPVIATITDAEGLNVQIYNRCVGTRFCSNNCIYKVRRFNFYYYGKPRESPLELALNPEVTVRWRGIMEKCTFCVQRIKNGHYEDKMLGRPYADGSVQTACQQTCPSGAIYFGDINDPQSRMMQARTERGYRVLEEKNFQPSVTYLTKVRNRPVTAADKDNA